MLEQDFKTLERTPEVVAGWNTVPYCWNRMLCVGTGLFTSWNRVFEAGTGWNETLYDRYFHSWNRTTSVESDSFQSWKFTLKVGTRRNRNLHVGIQLIDDGKGIWKWKYVGTGLLDIGKDSGSSNRM